MSRKQRSLAYSRWMLRLIGWWAIPMVGWVCPRLISINDEEAQLRIRLRRRTRNHLKSMYFGALAVGADVAAGLHVFYFSDQLGIKPSFAFRSMKAEFHKRAMGDVMFIMKEGLKIKQLLEETMSSGERVHGIVHVEAFVGEELVAEFEMEVSLKTPLSN